MVRPSQQSPQESACRDEPLLSCQTLTQLCEFAEGQSELVSSSKSRWRRPTRCRSTMRPATSSSSTTRWLSSRPWIETRKWRSFARRCACFNRADASLPSAAHAHRRAWQRCSGVEAALQYSTRCLRSKRADADSCACSASARDCGSWKASKHEPPLERSLARTEQSTTTEGTEVDHGVHCFLMECEMSAPPGAQTTWTTSEAQAWSLATSQFAPSSLESAPADPGP